MKIDWRQFRELLIVALFVLAGFGTMAGAFWINSEIWVHVSPLASWIVGILEVLVVLVAFSIRKKK